MKRLLIKRFGLLLSSILFPFFLLLLLEGATRILKPGVNFQDTEKNLLQYKAFGHSYGWRPNSTGISFGKQVYIDEFGFRKMRTPEKYQESWLILGDSVTFGVGVEADETYAQLLQDNLSQVRAWNTAVIGYDVRNYSEVLQHLLKDNRGVPEPKRVLLFFCLNDVDLGQELEKYLDTRSEHFAESLLSFLRRHSKLYMLLKNTVSDRSRFYFTQDYKLYAGDNANFSQSMNIIYEMKEFLRARGIDFTIIILPYEYQLRERSEANLLPQKRLRTFFEEKGISYIDAFDYFAREPSEKEDFLYADFAHLSAKGHRVVFNLLKERLNLSATNVSSGESANLARR